MKRICMTIIVTCMALSINAQDPAFEWAKQIGGSYWDEGTSVTTDIDGNIYLLGRFSSTIDFASGQSFTSNGYMDILIQKLDTDGNLVWVKQIGGSGFEYGASIITDIDGNVYITGNFSSTVDFDTGSGMENLTSAGGSDIFIQKLDTNGNTLWAKRVGGSSNESGYAINVDTDYNVYITGRFKGAVDFDPGPGVQSFTSLGGYDIFIQKLDTNGNLIWVKQIGGSSDDGGYSIATDINDDLYVTGRFKLTVDFDPGAGVQNFTSVGGYDIFIQKLDTNGNLTWVKQVGGSGLDTGQSVIDANGNIYTSGGFTATVDFDPGSGTQNFTSMGERDLFVQKIDANGNFLWARQMGGNNEVVGSSITIDTNANIYTIGGFKGIADFDPGAGVQNLASAGDRDIFIQKLDATGNLIWAKQMGGINTERGSSITTDTNGNLYTTGYFQATVDVDPGLSIENFESAGAEDIFIQKLSISSACVADLILTNPNDNYQTGDQIQQTAGNSITANNTVGTGATVSYDAATIISLTNGFTVEAGSDFEAIIGGCAP